MLFREDLIHVRAQIKVVLLVAVILTVVLGSVIWKTQSNLIDDQASLILDSTMKQIAPLKRLVSENLETEKNDLVRFAAAREAEGAGGATAFASFDTIALVEPANSQWIPTWIEKSSNLRSEKWPQGYDVTLLKSLPYARVKEGSLLWVRLSDAQGAPLFAILNSVEVQAPTAATAPLGTNVLPPKAVAILPGGSRQAILVGFSSENPLASITEDFIGSTNSVFLVDDRGYVASHVKKSYLGNSFVEDSITKEIIKTPKLSGTRQVIDMDGQPVLAHFEKIEHSNLTAVIETPASALTSLASQQLHTMLTVGGGIGLLGLLFAWLVGATLVDGSPSTARASRRIEYGEEAEDDIKSSAQTRILPAAPSGGAIVAAPLVATTERLLDERKSAFEAFNAGMAARLREPLLAILGHAHLAKTKTSDPAIIAHANSIEREARLAKESIERFQIIEESASLKLQVTETCDLEKVALGALAEKAIEIEGSGIILEQKLAHVPRVRGRASDLESAIVHLLDNAIEALRDRPEKKLTLQLSWLNDHVRFLVKDSGVGMTRDIQTRAFEPFYKGFEAPRHMGLGLSFVQTTLKRIGATPAIESSLGEGTLVSIDFPVELEAKREFEAMTAAPKLQSVYSEV